MKTKQKIYRLENKLSKELTLDIAFPDRKNSKTEALKAEILYLKGQ